MRQTAFAVLLSVISMLRSKDERNMIKQIVFDIGNVLTDFRWRKVLENCGFSEEAEKALAQGVFLNSVWAEYDRGVMGDEAVTAALKKACAGFEREFDVLYEHFSELVEERPFAEPLVSALKEAGYSVYILSNYGDTMYRCNAVRFAFLKKVDGGIFSYREKVIKPDPAIYRLLLDRYGLKARECLFLDDLEANVRAARDMGMEAETVNSRDTIMAALQSHHIRF